VSELVPPNHFRSFVKLLIVDDNTVMRKSIRSIVSDATDSVFECANGSLALTVYAEELPDFVLMDINMPEVNGIKATANLKKIFPEARVLIVTNYSEREFREKAKEAGADKYFLKDSLMSVKEYLQTQR
jgi:DNA-binding NarL/FixJ family response regulator